MPYTAPTPSTVAPGDTFPATAYNIIAGDIADHETRIKTGVESYTTAQKAALTGVTAGTVVYDSTLGIPQIYNGSAWIPIGEQTFTNESARNAAIPSPAAGMSARLTAPTGVSVTTGAQIPSVIQTVYTNGVWACVSEIGSNGSAAGQSLTTSYTDLTAGGTAASITLVTGTSAMVTMSALVTQSSGVTRGIYISAAVSGASTVASSDTFAVGNQSPNALYIGISGSLVISGLTPGSNTFTLQARADLGISPTFNRRSISVKALA